MLLKVPCFCIDLELKSLYELCSVKKKNKTKNSEMSLASSLSLLTT